MATRAKKQPPSFLEATRTHFKKWFADPESWRYWLVVCKAIFAEPMDEAERAIFTELFGRETPPDKMSREVWAIMGRQSGKSTIATLLAVYLACFRSYKKFLAPGARGTVLLLASDTRQSKRLLTLVEGIFDAVPELRGLVINRTAECISLRNQIDIQVIPADHRRVRSFTTVACVADEVSSWYSDALSANPDFLVLNAVRGGMIRIPNALLVCITTPPHGKVGTSWEAFLQRGDPDSPMLVANASSRTMNPGIDPALIDREFKRDPQSAMVEFDAQFLDGAGAYVAGNVLEAARLKGVSFLPPQAGKHYVAFFDPASGSGEDSAALAIASVEDRTVVRIKEWTPPFSPAEAVAEACAVLREYRVTTITGDNWASGFVETEFGRHRVRYAYSEKSASGLYYVALGLLNSGQVKLIDDAKAFRQLGALVRTANKVTHRSGAHDDVANVCAGCLTLAAEQAPRFEAARSADGDEDVAALQAYGICVARYRIGGIMDDGEDEREPSVDTLARLDELRQQALASGTVNQEYLDWLDDTFYAGRQIAYLKQALQQGGLRARLERSQTAGRYTLAEMAGERP